jgi:Immunity protein 51
VTSPALAPLRFFEYDHKPGTYSLLLSDFDAAQPTFERLGLEGGGYSWAGVARSAIRTHAPDLADRVRFDPEAGMFVAYGTDAAALKKLGRLLALACHDPKELERLIRAGEPDWFD